MKLIILFLLPLFSCAPTARSLIHDAWQTEDPDKSLKLYLNAYKLEAQNLDALRGLGSSYLQKEIFDSSLFYYKKAIKIDPAFKDGHAGLSKVYEKMGDYKQAIKSAKQIIQIEPGQTQYYCRVSNLYFKMGNCSKSIEYSDKAITMGDHSVFPEFQKAKCYLKLKDIKKAKELYLLAKHKTDSLNIGLPFPAINDLVTLALDNDSMAKNILLEVFEIDNITNLDYYDYYDNSIVEFAASTEKPLLMVKPIPKYPQEAIDNNIEGRAVIAVLIGHQGDVLAAYVMRSTHPLLNREALKAGYGLKFKPAKLDGKPVKVRMVIPFDFRLNI